MKTNSQRIVWALVAGALIMATHITFAMGSDYPAGKHVIGPSGWPRGLVSMINVTNRVHGFWVNQEDIFFFSGDAAKLTSFLRDYSRLPDVASKRLVLHEGVGEAKSPWGKVGQPCDWKLYVCPKGWHNVGMLSRQGTNSVEVLQKAATEPGYIMEVHFWTNGSIKLDQIEVPKNVELKKD